MIEYRVKPVTRYVVTRYEKTETGGGVSTVGEYDNAEIAYHVGYAMCRTEHAKAGTPPDDMNFVYPSIPEGVTVQP